MQQPTAHSIPANETNMFADSPIPETRSLLLIGLCSHRVRRRVQQTRPPCSTAAKNCKHVLAVSRVRDAFSSPASRLLSDYNNAAQRRHGAGSRQPDDQSEIRACTFVLCVRCHPADASVNIFCSYTSHRLAAAAGSSILRRVLAIRGQPLAATLPAAAAGRDVDQRGTLNVK